MQPARIFQNSQPNSSMNQAIDSYFTYTKIVADDDHGKTFSDSEYKNYIEKIARKRDEHRIYANWCLVDLEAEPDSQTQLPKILMDCKAIGPETTCFCGCRFKNHAVDQPTVNSSDDLSQKIKVKCLSCKNCKNFKYIPPVRGPSKLAKCSCKHEVEFHRRNPNKICSQQDRTNCGCTGYRPVALCSCKNSALQHRTIFENRKMRVYRNQKTDLGCDTPNAHAPDYGQKIPIGVLYKGLGGLVTMTSNLSGQERFEIGIGPSAIPVSQPKSSMHSNMIDLYKNLE